MKIVEPVDSGKRDMSPKRPAHVAPGASSFPIEPSPANEAKATQLQTKPDDWWLWVPVVVGGVLIGYALYRHWNTPQPQRVEFVKARDQGYGRANNPDNAALF
jgi:hypothetical protein